MYKRNEKWRFHQAHELVQTDYKQYWALDISTLERGRLGRAHHERLKMWPLL